MNKLSFDKGDVVLAHQFGSYRIGNWRANLEQIEKEAKELGYTLSEDEKAAIVQWQLELFEAFEKWLFNR